MSRQYTKNFRKGQVIYKEGEAGDHAYLIDEGQVELRSGQGQELVAQVGPGEIFGEMAVIDGSPRVTTALAVEDTSCCLVGKEQINERINDSDPVVRLLLVTYINRLRSNFKKSFGIDDEKSRIIDIKSFGSDFLSRAGMKTDEQVIEKIHFEQALKEGLAGDEYVMHFQPILKLADRKVAGVEALIRTRGPKWKGIGPDILMEIAEETSLIVELGQWVIKNSCAEFAKFKSGLKKAGQDPSDIFLSINVSGRQLGDPDFFDVLQKAAWRNKIKARDIKIEITERVLVNTDAAVDWIGKMRSLGFSVAIDDFGTGHTNLSFIGNTNVNNIKIDKSFVQKMEDNKNMRAIVKSLIAMAKSLGMSVVAEGIETEYHDSTLQEMGCDYGQGWLFARPMSMDALLAWMAQGSRKKAA